LVLPTDGGSKRGVVALEETTDATEEENMVGLLEGILDGWLLVE
jgi:hypothetical protein